MKWLKKKLFRWLVADNLDTLRTYLENEIAGAKDELLGDLEAKADQTEIDQIDEVCNGLSDRVEALEEA